MPVLFSHRDSRTLPGAARHLLGFQTIWEQCIKFRTKLSGSLGTLGHSLNIQDCPGKFEMDSCFIPRWPWDHPGQTGCLSYTSCLGVTPLEGFSFAAQKQLFSFTIRITLSLDFFTHKLLTPLLLKAIFIPISSFSRGWFCTLVFT